MISAVEHCFSPLPLYYSQISLSYW